MDDIRYSEFVFLQKLATSAREFEYFNASDNFPQAKAVGLDSTMYVDMAITLLEDLSIRFDDGEHQKLVAQLRGEVFQSLLPANSPLYPRDEIERRLRFGSGLRLRITYRGRRRIEELRELLRRDRILEPFGVLLDIRYVVPDLQDALGRDPNVPVSVLCADMDDFKQVNTEAGHGGGDVVMTAYLEAAKDAIGVFGNAYRGRGDEVVGVILGQGHGRAIEVADTLRKKVESMRCEHKGKKLPRVTTSIGVATSPPLPRTLDLQIVADQRNKRAKDNGKNCVVAD